MKRVLFIDDDQSLLNGLRSRLYKRRKDWDMVFIDNGPEALSKLDEQSVDLIVTDIRMPGLDGVELLKMVKERWPRTIRVVLSGYSEPEKLLQLVSLAHRYVSKPCDASQLENVIERCLLLDDLLGNEKLKSLVGRISALPSLPKVYSQLQESLANDNVQAGIVADIIGHDAAITAKVLQVANSAFFRLAKPMSNIKQAVGHLGFTTIRNLVMAAEVFTPWKNLEVLPGLEPDRLQANAEHSAAACIALGKGTSMRDDAMLVGLLHDIGYWILLKESPKELTAAFELSRNSGMPSEQAEREILGASHADIGAYLLGLWGFPYPIVEAVAFHHTPQKVSSSQFDLLAILCTAHSLSCDEPSTVLNVSSEMMPLMNENDFGRLNPPYDWREAMQRISDLKAMA